jgi:hypothetical protein
MKLDQHGVSLLWASIIFLLNSLSAKTTLGELPCFRRHGDVSLRFIVA